MGCISLLEMSYLHHSSTQLPSVSPFRTVYITDCPSLDQRKPTTSYRSVIFKSLISPGGETVTGFVNEMVDVGGGRIPVGTGEGDTDVFPSPPEQAVRARLTIKPVKRKEQCLAILRLRISDQSPFCPEGSPRNS
jgi:hypothetical protein